MADTNQLNCCAVDELYDIGEQSPQEILRDVCRGIWPERRFWYDDDYDDGQPAAFYVFTACVGYTKRGAEINYDTGAGPNLAAYIRRNKLGTIVQSPIRINRVNHPSHKVRVWVWSPSERNLKKWWNKEKGND